MTKPYTEKIIVSKMADEAAILSLFGEIRTTKPNTSFSFLNIYKELPVSNKAVLFDIKGKHVEFKTNQLQFAAIHHNMETIIQAPFLDASILGRLTYLDGTHHLVSLGNFSYADIHFNKRAAVRVRLKVPLNVNLSVDGNRMSGMIRDVSLHGCCVTTPAGALLGQANDIQLHLRLMHDNKTLEAHVPVRLLRIDGAPLYNCAMAFDHTVETEKVLAIFVHQRQLEIIRELKEKC
ncbi:MAG TPA: PilZ domain-containing protein [Desulfuromonadaceae bacterium]